MRRQTLQWRWVISQHRNSLTGIDTVLMMMKSRLFSRSSYNYAYVACQAELRNRLESS